MQSIPVWLMADDRNKAGEGERTLLTAARSGDATALEHLLEPHEQSLLRLCRGMLGHVEEAEDAVQETFLRALRSLARFRGDAGFRTWLFRIAINVCLDRKSNRQQPVSLNEQHPGDTQSDSPETAVLRQWQIMAALQTLPPQRRALLMLKEVEGWSVAEIATALRCNEKRIHNELYQARRALNLWRQRAAQEENRP